jgi:hypothetical protein
MGVFGLTIGLSETGPIVGPGRGGRGVSVMEVAARNSVAYRLANNKKRSRRTENFGDAE